MYANIRDIYWEKPPTKKRHPEAPEAGEEVMYVDFSRENLATRMDEWNETGDGV